VQFRAADNLRSRRRRTEARPSAADTGRRDPRNLALEPANTLRSAFATYGQAQEHRTELFRWGSHPSEQAHVNLGAGRTRVRDPIIILWAVGDALVLPLPSRSQCWAVIHV
jgi:hypothetical protein